MEIELFKIYDLNQLGKVTIGADKIFILQRNKLTGLYDVFCQMLNGVDTTHCRMTEIMIKHIVDGFLPKREN